MKRIDKACSLQALVYSVYIVNHDSVNTWTKYDIGFAKESSFQRNLGPEQAILVVLRLRIVSNMFDYDEFTAMEFINRLG